MSGYVYIMASQRNGTLYVGVTNEIRRRVVEHKDGGGSRFTGKYKVNTLVYYEFHEDIEQAIQRESQIKAWQRAWKLRLVEERNPQWKDLLHELA
ncbi:MAG: GIY-YIG nuclease family protein [Pseudomonadaceae bacterium]|nr:GIY-YIG nuclease family protein [Pseudomonadaceae bacterium]